MARMTLNLAANSAGNARPAIKAHPLSLRIDTIQGSTIAPEIVTPVDERTKPYEMALAYLNLNHTDEHVLAELQVYVPFTSIDNYCEVLYTIIEDTPEDMLPDRPGAKGNNPKTAVAPFQRRPKKEGRTAAGALRLHFKTHKMIENKVFLTVAFFGYLRSVKRECNHLKDYQRKTTD